MVKVILHTEVHPEDNAMLQALYSRSAESVTDHIEKLRTVGSGKFMSQFYLGYGHASIADCGFITVYIEGVSMLCAKAIQDDPLYNGQESSSRYIDWTSQKFINPYMFLSCGKGLDSGKLLEAYREFYITQKPVIIEHLKQQFAKKEDEKDTLYEKSITAKAFDILRGYLPCGSATNVAWTTSLRKANERLQSLALHPLIEVRDVAQQIHKILIAEYPNSIGPLIEYEDADPYLKAEDNFYGINYENPFQEFATFPIKEIFIQYNIFDQNSDTKKIPESTPDKRPRKVRLPKHALESRARLNIETELDFGSYRDLQRHRANYCTMPIVSAIGGFNQWYYDQLPEASRKEADNLFEKITDFVYDHVPDASNNLEMQYLLPMGTVVPIIVDTDVAQAVYLAELRSGQTVHATLRPLAQEIGRYLETELGIPTTCDFSEDEWNIRRGSQDIFKKEINP